MRSCARVLEVGRRNCFGLEGCVGRSSGGRLVLGLRLLLLLLLGLRRLILAVRRCSRVGVAGECIGLVEEVRRCLTEGSLGSVLLVSLLRLLREARVLRIAAGTLWSTRQVPALVCRQNTTYDCCRCAWGAASCAVSCLKEV